jgi:hypothetical protein
LPHSLNQPGGLVLRLRETKVMGFDSAELPVTVAFAGLYPWGPAAYTPSAAAKPQMTGPDSVGI